MTTDGLPAGESQAYRGHTDPEGGRPALLAYILPLVVFSVLTAIEPKPRAEDLPDADAHAPASAAWYEIEYRHYPLVYSTKIALTVAAMAYAWPVYRRTWRRPGALAVLIGVLGVVAWVLLAMLQERLGSTFEFGKRSAFNPLQRFDDQPGLAFAFLAVRLLGLVVVVPIAEEFFLRGFLVRYLVDQEWWRVPFGTINRAALIAITVAPILMHPNEALAALVWFSAVTWLMVRTRNIWDCVAAHAITNLLLGAYVISTGNWWLM